MIEAHARIHIRNHDTGAAGSGVPGRRRVYRRRGRWIALQVPLLHEQWITGCLVQIAAFIDGGVFDFRLGAQACQGGSQRRAGLLRRNFQHLHARSDAAHQFESHYGMPPDAIQARGGALARIAHGRKRPQFEDDTRHRDDCDRRRVMPYRIDFGRRDPLRDSYCA